MNLPQKGAEVRYPCSPLIERIEFNPQVSRWTVFWTVADTIALVVLTYGSLWAWAKYFK